MKEMTCSQMGGPCEEKILASSEDEMMAKGMEHLEAVHPEVAADVKAMPEDHPKMVEWVNKFKEDYAAAPHTSPEM